MNLKHLLSPARAAEIRGVSLPRIIAMVNDGKLTAVPYDGGYLLKRSEVEGYEPKKGGRPPTPRKKATKK